MNPQVEIEMEPALQQNAGLSAACLIAADMIAEKLETHSGKPLNLERVSFEPAKSGRARAAKVFIRYHVGTKLAASWLIKAYEAADEPVYNDEVARLNRCKDLIQQDVFSANFRACGRCADYFVIAYSDAGLSVDRNLTSLDERLNSLSSDQALTAEDSMALKGALKTAWQALALIAEDKKLAYSQIVSHFSARWLPHFTFTSPNFEIDRATGIASIFVDGVRQLQNPTPLSFERMREVSAMEGADTCYESPLFPFADVYANSLYTTTSQTRLLINFDADTARGIERSRPKFLKVYWRGIGYNVTSTRKAVQNLYESSPWHSPSEQSHDLQSRLISLSAENTLIRCGGAHIDLHTGNLLVTRAGKLDAVKIIDLSDIGEAPQFADAARLEMSIWFNVASRKLASRDAFLRVWNLASPFSSSATQLNPDEEVVHRAVTAVRHSVFDAYPGQDTLLEYVLCLALSCPVLLRWASQPPDNEPPRDHRDAIALLLCTASAELAETALQRQNSRSRLDNGAPHTPSVPSAGDPPLHPRPAELPQASTDGSNRVDTLWHAALTINAPLGTGRVQSSLKEHLDETLSELGRRDLLPLQEKILKVKEQVFSPRRNVLIGGPTSSGKTFIADLALIREAFINRRPSIYVAPTRALAQERHHRLLALLPPSRRERVILSTGEDTDSDKELYQGDFDLACMVYEKANILYSTAGYDFTKVGLLVVDELHLIEDLHRGNVLELLITKTLDARKALMNPQHEAAGAAGLPRVMLITTEQSVEQPKLRSWLEDEDLDDEQSDDDDVRSTVLVMIDERPVPLEHFLLLPGLKGEKYEKMHVTTVRRQADLILAESVYERIVSYCDRLREDGIGIRIGRAQQAKAAGVRRKICEAYLERLIDCVSPGSRILVFSPSKEWLLQLARHLKKVPRIEAQLGNAPDKVAAALSSSEPSESTREIRKLSELGIFFHNADIDQQVRLAIQEHFSTFHRGDQIELVMATSTLSYGVNLSVDYVVLIQPRFPATNRFGDVDEKFLSMHEYHNMLGRTGRYGLADKGEACVICDLGDIDPVGDVLQRYYYTPTSPRRDVTSGLLVREDRQAVRTFSAGRGGQLPYSNPLIRSVLDALRHVENRSRQNGRPVAATSADEVATFLGTTYFGFGANPRDEKGLRKATIDILAFCAQNDLHIIESIELDEDGNVGYRPTALSDALIDTGTELQTLQPLLAWERHVAASKPEQWPVEMNIFGLILVPEVWRKGQEFAPESKADFPADDMFRELNRARTKGMVEEELSVIGVRRPAELVAVVEAFVRDKAARVLTGTYAYEEASIDISFRIFTALCRWISGRPINEIEQAARQQSRAGKFSGSVARIRFIREKVSWLAVAYHRCLRHSAFGAGEAEELEESLLTLSLRLRHGIQAEGWPLYNRHESKLLRHHVASLVRDGLTIDSVLSEAPEAVREKIKGSLEACGHTDSEHASSKLLRDLANFSLKQERELASQLTDRGTDEEIRLVADKWKNIREFQRELVFDESVDHRATIELAARTLNEAIGLLGGVESSASGEESGTVVLRSAGHKGSAVQAFSLESDVDGIVAQTKFAFRVVNPLVVAKAKGGGIAHVCVSPSEVQAAANEVPPADVVFLVGFPWFLPSVKEELVGALGDRIASRRWILVTSSGMLTIVVLILRRLLGVSDMRRNLVEDLPEGLSFLKVEQIVQVFDLSRVPAPIRESISSYRDVSFRRRDRSG
jgi:hypothetical protein